MRKNSKDSIQMEVEGREIQITHPDKLLFPDPPLKKREIVDYFLEIGPLLLPHLQERPLTLWPFPEGIESPGYIIKQAPKYLPSWIRTWSHYSEGRGDLISWVIAGDLPSLIFLVNLGCLDFHPWLSRIDLPDNPDFVVFDLDPEPDASFKDLIKVALLIKELLARWDLEVFPKTSGGRGLHLFLPIERIYSFEITRKFVQTISQLLDSKFPNLIATEWKKEERQGKVRIDFAQNSQGRTMASVYSIRPRPGAPVSCPLNWEELEKVNSPEDFNPRVVLKRVKTSGDLFLPTIEKKQKVDTALKELEVIA
ncbi:MAG: non-homologous end-joining DNA ligase [Caldiserica bacterium]|jgi:bifunctional non-homologous end joining protein LigD|nr:non-homologous end-joining DNA ligase [Caldisericota bacterium]MDH7562669.1 non-homologous end-joining DNA ligase [Caldisericota bacterium]